MKNLVGSLFTKKVKSEPKPMGVITSVQRPDQPVNRISDDEKSEMIASYYREKEQSEKNDAYFVQEIVDRLYGPDADEYKEALKVLNDKYRSRVGRTGSQIYRDEF